MVAYTGDQVTASFLNYICTLLSSLFARMSFSRQFQHVLEFPTSVAFMLGS